MTLEKQIHVQKADKLICGLCETEVETTLSKCVICDIYMCTICTKGHTRIQATKDHEIIADYIQSLRSSSKKLECKIHPGEKFIYYCTTCSQLICSDCIVNDHSNHTCLKVKDAAKQKEEYLSKTLGKITDIHIPKINSKMKEVEALQNENDKIEIDTINKIKTRKDEFISEITKIECEWINGTKRLKEQNEKFLNQIHTSLVKDLSEMEDLSDKCDKVLSSGSTTDKIVAEQEIKNRLEQISSKPSDQDLKIQIPKFTSGNINISSLKQSFGFIDSGEEKGCDFDCYVSDKETQPETNLLAAQTVSTNIDVNVTSTFNHQRRQVTSICPITDNTAIIHCVREYSNDLVNTDGKVQRTLKLDFIVNDFVMTPHGIMATDADSTNIHKLTNNGHNKGSISTASLKPNCLCMSSDGNLLVTLVNSLSYEVDDDSRRLVARMSTSGLRVKTYEYDRGVRLFTVPWSIAENKNGDICVVNKTSCNRGNLVILDNEGRLKVTYRGETTDEQFDPDTVKCDELGHIIVSDYGNKNIHLLNIDGQFVQYLLTNKELTHYPRSLATTTGGFLWVGCKNGKVYFLKYLNQLN